MGQLLLNKNKITIILSFIESPNKAKYFCVNQVGLIKFEYPYIAIVKEWNEFFTYNLITKELFYK